MIVTSVPQLLHKHDDLLGNEIEIKRLLRVNHSPCYFESGKCARVGACRKNHVLTDDRVFADLHRRGRDELSLALDCRDATHLDEAK
jgi:hypothetical protein